MRLPLLLIFLHAAVISFAQLQITGKIVTRQGKSPVAFANIGIVNSPTGTISNGDGTFSLTVLPSQLKDTLVFSALGYSKKKIPVSYFSDKPHVVLQLSEKTTVLESVTVTGKKQARKHFKLGNKYNRGGNIYGDTVAAGAAMALLIENKYPSYHADLEFPVYVENASLRISKNTLPEFKVRVRLMEVDSVTGLPGRDLLQESVVTTSSIRQGWINFDLTPYSIKIMKPRFFLTFEWIQEDKERIYILNEYTDFRRLYPEKVTVDTVVIEGKKVTFNSWHGFMEGTSFSVAPIPFSLEHYKSYYRNNSFGQWKRASAILTARIQVSNQPTMVPGAVSSSVVAEIVPCAEPDPACHAVQMANEFIEDHDIQGMQLAVSVNKKLAFSDGFGLADVDRATPVTTRTRFRIGSLSKALTSAALVKLVADKKLDLDAPVQKYVPTFPKKQFPITTRQLAGHLSGIRHYREDDLADFVHSEHYASATEALAIFEDDSLLFKPGTSYLYSSFGWNVIGAVMEGASGENYLNYMLKNIWLPMGMSRTYGAVKDSVMANQSKQYDYTGEEMPAEDLSYKYASGGLLSTCEDLVTYGNQLLHGKVLDRALTATLFESQHTTDGVATNYGMGWFIGQDKNGHRIWFHSGQLLNGSGYLILYPDDDMVIAFLSNGQDGLLFDIQKVGELFYK